MGTVLITGANRGIGLELVRRYAAAGHDVLACCRDPETAGALAELAGDEGRVEVLGVTVADAASVAELGARLAGRPLDVLINNAGANLPREAQSLEQMDYDGWADLFAVNAMAPLRLLQALMANLKASAAAPPKAVTITSQMGALSLDWPVAYAYSSSKAAVNKVMRMAALDLKDDGIAVGLIHPGWVRTDMGGPQASISVEESAAGIIDVIDGLDLASTGSFLTWDGEAHAW